MMKANKALGQHFLHDADIARRVADSLLENPAFKAVVVVGPGQGVLTALIAPRYADALSLVEYDTRFIPLLEGTFPKLKGRIYQGDFLKFDLAQLEAPLAIIGNFPYNISSQILFHALDYKERVVQISGMFQKEMAKRVCAKEGSKDFGIISVLMQCYYDCEYLFDVGPASFNPPPQVVSGVIRLVKREAPLVSEEDYPILRMLVKTAFNQRRKMMRNSLKAVVKDPVVLQDKRFELRPEQLSLAGFVELTHWFKSLE